MNRITNSHAIKIKELISEDACMGTYGLVELELLEMLKELEAIKKERDEALIVLDGLNRAIGADNTGLIDLFSKEAFDFLSSLSKEKEG